MFWDDHNPPHFHAEYGDNRAQVDISALSLLPVACPLVSWVWQLNGRRYINKNCSLIGKERKLSRNWKG
jgi:hypothetical protein